MGRHDGRFGALHYVLPVLSHLVMFEVRIVARHAEPRRAAWQWNRCCLWLYLAGPGLDMGDLGSLLVTCDGQITNHGGGECDVEASYTL